MTNDMGSLLSMAISAPLSRAEKAEVEPPQALSQNDELEVQDNDKPYQIRSDVAIRLLWRIKV